ncbi:hypothetical protein E4198_17005 [Streptomyces sp. RKND-216]|nr:hypothetical protein E4198_17005 [Streptomyces sp. RKND-216]
MRARRRWVERGERVAVATGVGGANFASSTANVNALYPLRLKGRVLGVNAGGGNIGVAVVQLAGLALIALGGAGHPWALPALYVPLVVAATVWALRRRDNLGPVRDDTAPSPRRPGTGTPGSSPPSTSAPSARSSATASRSGWCFRAGSDVRRWRRPRSRSSGRCSARCCARSAATWPTGGAAPA